MIRLCALALIAVVSTGCRPAATPPPPGGPQSRAGNPALVSSASQRTGDLEHTMEDEFSSLQHVRRATVHLRLPADGYAPPPTCTVALELEAGAAMTPQQRANVAKYAVAVVPQLTPDHVQLVVH